MNFLQSLTQVFGSLVSDDNNLYVLAMLAGIIAGWTLTGLHQQMKAKKVRIEREQRIARLRKPD